MKLLLDTSAFLWYVRDDPQLSEACANAIEDPANTVYISVISLWEIAVKSSLEKLTLDLPLADFFRESVDDNGFVTLGVSRAHLLTVHALPWYHRDPFDRLLIAQAIKEGMTLATDNREVPSYPVSRLW